MVFAVFVAGIFGLATLAIALVIERLRDRARHASIRSTMGPPAAIRDPSGQVATLEGRLADDAPAVTTFHPRGTSYLDDLNAYAKTYHPADRPLVVELPDGGRAILDGEVQVLSGSLESEHGASLDDAGRFKSPLGDVEGQRVRIGQFRRLLPGDPVRVRGTLAPAPDDAALYRAASSVVRVEPPPHAVVRAIALASARAPKRVRTQPPRGAFLAAAGVALVVAVGLGSFTLRQLHALTAPEPPPAPPAGPEPCRRDVLAALEKNDASGAAQAVAACDDAYARAMVEVSRAELGAASDSFAAALAAEPGLTPSLTETETHLHAHQYQRASDAAKRMVAHFYPGPSTAEKRYLECIAAQIDDLATGRLERRTTKGDVTHPPSCSRTPQSLMVHGIDDERYATGIDDFKAAYEPVRNPFTALVGARGRLFARPVGVERDILDRWVLAPGPTRPPPAGALGQSDAYGVVGYGRLGFRWWTEAADIYVRLTGFAAELTLFYAWAGVPERAAPYWPILDRVAASREATPWAHFHESYGPGMADLDARAIEGENSFIEHVLAIATAAATLANDEARARRYAAHAETHARNVIEQVTRMAKGEPWEKPIEEGHWHDRVALFAAADGGDGAAVVAVLRKQGTTGAEALPRIVPRLVTNRAALDAWFDDGFPSPCLTCGTSSYLGHVVDRLRVARLLGKTAEADRLAPVVEALVAAQTDALVAWEIDELETFFARSR